jgi:hypothetical protein
MEAGVSMYIDNYVGNDLCFCNSNCTNISCSRCLLSTNYRNAKLCNTKRKHYVEENDFSGCCTKYMKPVNILTYDLI